MSTGTAAGSTVEKIMSVALEMVQRRGFSGFSFRDIATEVGIKTASIHYHFPTKPDLAKAVLNEVKTGFEQELARIDRDISDFDAQFSAFTAIFDDTFGDGDRLCPFCMVACAQDGVPDFVRDEVQQFWSLGEQWVQRHLDRGQQQGLVRTDIDTQSSGKVLVAMLEGAMITARAFGEKSRLDNARNWFLREVTKR